MTRSCDNERLWTRFGMNGEYEEWGHDLDAVAGILLEHCIESGEMIRCAGGFSTPNFSGAEYVSLYWGDAEGDKVRDLRPTEWTELLGRMEMALEDS